MIKQDASKDGIDIQYIYVKKEITLPMLSELYLFLMSVISADSSIQGAIRGV